MPNWTPQAPSAAYARSTGSLPQQAQHIALRFENAVASNRVLEQQGVRIESGGGAVYLRAGDLYQTQAGEYTKVTTTVADPTGSYAVTVTQVDVGASVAVSLIEEDSISYLAGPPAYVAPAPVEESAPYIDPGLPVDVAQSVPADLPIEPYYAPTGGFGSVAPGLGAEPEPVYVYNPLIDAYQTQADFDAFFAGIDPATFQ